MLHVDMLTSLEIVITDLNTDDEQIKENLLNPEAYQILLTYPTAFIVQK